MDPVEQQTALGVQGVLLGHHKQVIQILLDNMNALTQQVNSLVGANSPIVPHVSS